MPIDFFGLSVDCHQSDRKKGLDEKCLLPTTADLCKERSFAKVYLGWSLEGVHALIQVSQPYRASFFPNFGRGDSVELMFDTRDVKSSGYNTRFCHHFYFLPEPVDEYFKGEITHFRTEDRHELCAPEDLECKVQMKPSNYSMSIFLPKRCLHGYDPEQFQRLGFTYRINRYGGDSQHFSVITSEYQVEQQPALWSSLKLI